MTTKLTALKKFIFCMQSELSDVSPNEDFTISLGVDQSLRITCQPVQAVHNTRSGVLGGKKAASITYTHKFLVKNTKAHSAIIHVSEQVPLSTDDRIKVNVYSCTCIPSNIPGFSWIEKFSKDPGNWYTFVQGF